MTEEEFLARWHEERPAYEAWGTFVRTIIESRIATIRPAVDVEKFIKIPATPRSKSDESLIGKAFHRPEKKYADPYNDIEDKVGLRFVVLLASDIRKLQDLIEQAAEWNASLDRDFVEERDARPTEFAYQSVHYVLRSREPVDYNGVRIPANVPCEVQLRTLLQHAHSELTHDNVYKVQGGTVVTNKVHRTIAKSMALIETVDDFFERAITELSEATAAERHALAQLRAAYEMHTGLPPGNDQTNEFVIHAFKETLPDDLPGAISTLVERYPFIPTNIKAKYTKFYQFRQPWIILAYWLVPSKQSRAACFFF